MIMLPVYNEGRNIRRLLDRIRETLDYVLTYRVIAVNDGSTDETRYELEAFKQKLPLEIVAHDLNEGLGAAIRTGLLRAIELSQDSDVVITMDADDTHDPALILPMLEQIAAGSDVVIASRFRPGAYCVGVPFRRRVMSVGASLLFRVVFPTPGVRDFMSGFRAYRVRILEQARREFRSRLFEFGGFHAVVDLLLKLRGIGARFAEVPILLRYDLKQGPSKMPVFWTVLRTLRLVCKRRFSVKAERGRGGTKHHRDESS